MCKTSSIPELANEIHKLESSNAEKDREIELLKTFIGLIDLSSDEYRYYIEKAAEMLREAGK